MTRLEKRKEIDKVSRFVRAAETEINAMGILPRDPYKFPFDIVGLAAVSKAFALAKACINLLRSDLPDEAFGLIPANAQLDEARTTSLQQDET